MLQHTAACPDRTICLDTELPRQHPALLHRQRRGRVAVPKVRDHGARGHSRSSVQHPRDLPEPRIDEWGPSTRGLPVWLVYGLRNADTRGFAHQRVGHCGSIRAANAADKLYLVGQVHGWLPDVYRACAIHGHWWQRIYGTGGLAVPVYRAQAVPQQAGHQ